MSTEPTILLKAFGRTENDELATLFTLSNASGTRVSITNYGGIVTSIETPDRQGKVEDINLGQSSLDGYLSNDAFLGALVGRYANRIGGSAFEIDGTNFPVTPNDPQSNPPIQLHGGPSNFSNRIWSAVPHIEGGECCLTLEITSPDGDQGFPGNLKVKVIYTLTETGELRMDYEAATDRPTHVNLTNHCYFNLKGENQGTIHDHQIEIFADYLTEIDDHSIPTGALMPVEGTPFDLNESVSLGERLGQSHSQMTIAGGFDHNFVVRRGDAAFGLVARVCEPVSGRILEVLTDQPGIQLYTANGMDGTLVGKSGRACLKYGAFCLETQHYPDSPNRPEFPSTRLNPGELFQSTTVYRFRVQS
jgi:aldose 1-epimerase